MNNREGPRAGVLGLLGPPETLALLELAVLSIAVFLHWLQLQEVIAYRQSPLIWVEILGLNGAFLLMLIFLIRTGYLLCCRQFAGALVNAIICATALGVAIWAMWFDAPTLIYMT